MPPADVLDLSTVAVLPDPGDNAVIVSRDLPAGTRHAPTAAIYERTGAPGLHVSTDLEPSSLGEIRAVTTAPVGLHLAATAEALAGEWVR